MRQAWRRPIFAAQPHLRAPSMAASRQGAVRAGAHPRQQDPAARPSTAGATTIVLKASPSLGVQALPRRLAERAPRRLGGDTSPCLAFTPYYAHYRARLAQPSARRFVCLPLSPYLSLTTLAASIVRLCLSKP
jgi:hypothetical protein